MMSYEYYRGNERSIYGTLYKCIVLVTKDSIWDPIKERSIKNRWDPKYILSRDLSKEKEAPLICVCCKELKNKGPYNMCMLYSDKV